jgi:hypothetical protein
MRQFNDNLFLMSSYGQDEYLMTKTTPTSDVVDDDDDLYAALLQFLPTMTRR